MDIKLFDSELKVMDVLWQNGDLSAGELAKFLKEDIGWNRNTTYTVIKKCIAKGAVERYEPNFMCKPIITREQVQNYETDEFIEKLFQGSRENFFSAFLDSKKLTENEIAHLKNIIDKLN